MIKKFLFKNYKAFEYGELKIRPITVLLGPNSVGKSSIINLLLMLKQTANSSDYKSALRLHGENVSLGENKNIFRNQDTNNKLTIGFQLKKHCLNKTVDYFINCFSMPFKFLNELHDKEILENFQLSNYLDKRGTFLNKFQTKEFISKIIDLLNDNSLSRNTDKFNIFNYIKKSYNLNNKDNIELMYDFLNNIKHINKDNIVINFTIINLINQNVDSLKLQQISITQDDKIILDIDLVINSSNGIYESINLKSDFFEGNILDEKSQKELLSIFSYKTHIFNIASNYFNSYNCNWDYVWDFIGRSNDDLSIITRTLLFIIGNCINEIKNEIDFSSINHVSPLRALPRRYYFLDKSNLNSDLDSLDGNSLTEILKENDHVRGKVNNWLKSFGFKVDVSTLQDIIHKLKISQNDLSLDITDVGFGISQILPIIVQGFLSKDNSLTMIEQPEIHLHPKMQAELADLFIDITLSKEKRNNNKIKINKFLLIETHSEYFLKRLRRRIAEGKISKNNIAIYFIEGPCDKHKSTIIREIPISDKGSFEWPNDFYMDELQKDNLNFIEQLFTEQ